ncbi:hypothetical protein IWX75_003585 [Arthrobacter sp. CAN_A6]
MTDPKPSKASKASGTQNTPRWIAPSKGGYSGLTTSRNAGIQKRTPPKNPASSTRASSSTRGS